MVECCTLRKAHLRNSLINCANCCCPVVVMEDDELPDVVNMDKIEEGLYLGNLTAALDLPSLQQHHISHILTVETKPLPASITQLPGMAFHYIEIYDMPQEDLLVHFDEAARFIEEGQQKGNVLVHCYFGASRSAALVVCYLMKAHKWTVAKALHRVQSKRWCAQPNKGFMAQLSLYHSLGCSLPTITTNTQYCLYRLQVATTAVTRAGSRSVVKAAYQQVVQPDPRLPTPSLTVAYRCRSCRSAVISQESLVPHEGGEAPAWTDSKWSGSVQCCQQGVFTLPLAWMKDSTTTLEGKLHCPKCEAKLGSYSWTAGCCCPCGARIVPAFYFVPSKLDRCSQ